MAIIIVHTSTIPIIAGIANRTCPSICFTRYAVSIKDGPLSYSLKIILYSGISQLIIIAKLIFDLVVFVGRSNRHIHMLPTKVSNLILL